MTRERERELIEKAIEGDKDAAATFIGAYQRPLYAYLLRMSGRPDVAEDIVQEAFVRVLANLDRFDFRFRFSTWLFTIAKRLYVNACQKHKPAYDSDIVGGWQGKGGSPESPTISDEIHENVKDALQEALLSLPGHQREILILFHQHDWPIALIASHMEMPEGTIKSHLHRGRRRMRELLDQHETHARHVDEVWV